MVYSKMSSSTTMKTPTCPKYQYYQNDSFMTVSILEPNLNESTSKITFTYDNLTVQISKQNVALTVICGKLFSPVIVSKCKVKYLDDKTLIKLKKKHGHNWHTLFGGGATSTDRENESDEILNDVRIIGSVGETKTAVAAAAAATTTDTKIVNTVTPDVATDTSNDNDGGNDTTITTTNTISSNSSSSIPKHDPANAKHRPYASTRDWDAIERNLKKEEDDEKPEGESAFNSFLQKIYKDADEDTRRAMIKSYQTSGGTHLSCNWNEVEKTDYEKQRTAPKGQEWKNWEGQKLPMKEDD